MQSSPVIRHRATLWCARRAACLSVRSGRSGLRKPARLGQHARARRARAAPAATCRSRSLRPATRRSRPDALQHVKQVLGRNVAGRRRRERTAADAADAGVERSHAGLHRRVSVREAGVARVVEMAAQAMPGNASRTRAINSVTCVGTPTPIVSASAISNGRASATRCAISTTRSIGTSPSNGQPNAAET